MRSKRAGIAAHSLAPPAVDQPSFTYVLLLVNF
jgi:hypothetical protein